MKIGIAISTETQKLEILHCVAGSESNIQWVDSTETLMNLTDADCWVDCTFSGNTIPHFKKPTLIHSPASTLVALKTGSQVARFCAWSSFLNRELWEISVAKGSSTAWLQQLMQLLGRRYVMVKDEPGLVSPRIVCSIINEAYHALRAGISSPGEIDLAMKLGTGYPYGPLEWGNRIGLTQVHDLLQILSVQNNLYQPAFQVSYP